jgi:glycosyltransferase involved in cell wall biosynthesis
MILLHSLEGAGAARRVVWLANRFVALGRAVQLLVVDPRGPLLRELDERVRLRKWESKAVAWPWLRARRKAAALANFIEESGAQVVLSGCSQLHGIAARGRALATERVPLVLRANDSWECVEFPASLFGATWRERARRRHYVTADAIVAVSYDLATSIRTLIGNEKPVVHVIYNPADIRAGTIANRPEKKPGKLPLLLAGSRFCPQKDFATLIRAFALVRKEMPARLVLLGEAGPESRRLVRLILQLRLEDAIEMPGWVDDVAAWLARADVYVSSSLAEGLPGMMIEALTVGTPVVATDCPGGTREALWNGELGTLVPPRNPAALAAAIIAAIGTPPDRGRLQDGARRFDDADKAEAYLRILDNSVASAAP